MPLLCKGPECPDYYEVDNGMQAYAQDRFKNFGVIGKIEKLESFKLAINSKFFLSVEDREVLSFSNLKLSNYSFQIHETLFFEQGESQKW